MDDIGTELADLGTKAGTFFEKDLPDFFTDLGTKIANTFSGGGNSGAVSVPEVPPLPSYTAPPAPSFTAPAAPSFAAPTVPSFAAPDVGAGGGGDFDIGKIFTTDLEAYANTALSWVEANPATFTLWVLVIVVLILACVGIGMAASMPTSAPAPPPPVAQAPAQLPPMPFSVDTSGNVTFPAKVTYNGDVLFKGNMAVTGQSTLSGLTLSQQFTVQSLTVNDTLSAGNITATGSLTSNATTNLGGAVTINGDDTSTIDVNSLTGRSSVKSGPNSVVAKGEIITINYNGTPYQISANNKKMAAATQNDSDYNNVWWTTLKYNTDNDFSNQLYIS